MDRFSKGKIERAIERAAFEVLRSKTKARTISHAVTDIVIKKIVSLYKDRIPSVESIDRF